MWALTNALVEGIKSTQESDETKHPMKQSIREVKKTDNKSIRAQTKIIDEGYSGINKSKFKYAGHITRAENDRIAKNVTECRLFERGRGRTRPRAEKWELFGTVMYMAEKSGDGLARHIPGIKEVVSDGDDRPQVVGSGNA